MTITVVIRSEGIERTLGFDTVGEAVRVAARAARTSPVALLATVRVDGRTVTEAERYA